MDIRNKRYGIPYLGSKSRVADIIIDILPRGNRLVDLFGGGGAITHCALLSDKWDKILYNDLNPLPTRLFVDAITGKCKNENRVITRDEFFRLRDTDPYVKYCWSFGNNGKDYLWSKEIEDAKVQACRIIMSDDKKTRLFEFYKFIKMLKTASEQLDSGCLEGLQSLERLESLQRLGRLQELEGVGGLKLTERLEVLNIDYRDYVNESGDVVYCDIPYEKECKGFCDNYDGIFDSYVFYDWVKSRDYQVFFSSREISDSGFYRVKIKDVSQLVGNTNANKVAEYLYSNKEIKV